MIVTFEEKLNKQYEVQDENVVKIFDEMKEVVLNAITKYEDNNKDIITCLMALGSITVSMNQELSNKYGADRLIEITQAKEIEKVGE